MITPFVINQGVGGMGSFSDFDPNSPSVPRNCTITRPPPITKPCRSRATTVNMNTELFVRSVAMFCYIFLDELRWPA